MAGLTTVGMCCRERTVDGQTSDGGVLLHRQPADGGAALRAALRGHWGIENNLHWQLDVSFGEDASRFRTATGRRTSLFRKTGLGLLKQHPRKDSIARKRKRAALDTDFLAETLAGANKVEKFDAFALPPSRSANGVASDAFTPRSGRADAACRRSGWFPTKNCSASRATAFCR